MKYLLLIFTFMLSDFSRPFLKEFKGQIVAKQAEAASKIFYAKSVSGTNGWSISMINPDGSNEEVLIPSKSGQGEYNPAVSPDGSEILFNTYRYGGWKLSSQKIGSSTITRITNSSNYFFNGAYSPDGKQIVYEKVCRGCKTQICIANSDGSDETLLTPKMGSIENRMPVWTPDQKSVLFYNASSGVNDIMMLEVESKKIINLTSNGGNDFNPAVSPNGKEVAFFSDRNGFLDLYIMDISGDNQRLLTKKIQGENNKYNYYRDQNQYWMFKASWSPDGESLVFTNVQSDNIDLFVIKKDGTDLSRITKTPQSELTPHWGLIRK